MFPMNEIIVIVKKCANVTSQTVCFGFRQILSWEVAISGNQCNFNQHKA